MKYKTYNCIILSISCGLFLAFSFVNPYGGNISLSQLVLQLSGSRGEFPLGLSIPELVSFATRLIPNYIFQIYFGTQMYRHFCTASVYVFSRVPNRIHWYIKEFIQLAEIVFLYQTISLATVFITTLTRYNIYFDKGGMALLAYHLALQSLLLFSLTLIINLLAIKIGSSTSFFTVAGIQILSISLLAFTKLIQDNTGYVVLWLNSNLVAHVIIGWHSSKVDTINQVIWSPYPGLNLNYSLLFMLGLCAITLIIGAVVVNRHDLISTNSEMGAG